MSPTPRYLSRILLVLLAGAALMTALDGAQDCDARAGTGCHLPAAWSSVHDD